MRISIRHEFRFTCEPGTVHAVQHALLTPRETPTQKIIEWSISMPGMDTAASFTDAFGNIAHLVSQTRPEEDLFIAVSGMVDTVDASGVLGRLPDDANTALFRRITPQTRPNGNLVNRLKAHQKAGMSRVDMMHWLMKRLHEARDSSAEDEGEVPEIIAEDHAHVFVAALRGIEVPARFVNGYVIATEDQDARAHCWAEAWDEALGWIGFDPSADLCPTDAYVRVAVGLDAETAAPIRLVPNMPRVDADVVQVTQVMMANQQQQ